jgi:hypothetical protein
LFVGVIAEQRLEGNLGLLLPLGEGAVRRLVAFDGIFQGGVHLSAPLWGAWVGEVRMYGAGTPQARGFLAGLNVGARFEVTPQN